MHSTRHAHSSAALLAATLSVALIGCASTARDDGVYRGSGSLSPSEQSLRRQSSDLTRTNTQACVTVGAAAALATLLLSGGRSDAGERAAVAALAGCGVGIGVNSYVQHRRQQYAYSEQRLQAMIQDVRQDNAKVARLISTSREVMETDRQRIADVNRAYKRKDISLAQARREMSAVEDNRNHLKQTLAALRKKESDWVQISRIERGAGADTRGLDAEIAKLRGQIATLEEELRLMDQQIRVSPVSA
jgi:ribosomal protein S24E